MLMSNNLDREHLWSRLQQPPRPANLPTDYLLLMAALDTGWQITGPVRILPAFNGAQCGVYLFTLSQSQTGAERQLSLKQHPRIDDFIRQENLLCETGFHDGS